MATKIIARDEETLPYKYTWNTFIDAGVDNFSAPPTQNPEMFELLTNVMPIVDGSLDRRWGYQLWNDSTVEHKQFFPYRNETANQQLLVGTGDTFTAVYGEDGSLYRSSIFSPTSNSREPRMVTSRSNAFFADGATADYKKWNGLQSGGVTKWGIDINDTNSTATQGPFVGTVAADQGAGGSSGSEGPLTADIAVNDDTGSGSAWSTPTNALVEDSTAATVFFTSNSAGPSSDVLKITDFDFSIPSGVTIVGVLVTVKHKCTDGQAGEDVSLFAQLYKGGVLTGSSKSIDHGAAETSFKTRSFGSSLSMWGATLTVSDVNATNFGVGLSQAGNEAPDEAESVQGHVDSVKVTVYYTMVSSTSWTSPNNILLDDAATTIALVSTSPTSELRVTDFTSFTIADTASVAGLEVTIEVSTLDGAMTIAPIMIKDGVAYGQRKTLEIATTGTYTFGGATDLWEGVWTPANVKATTFGLQFYAQAASGTFSLGVDVAKIKVYAVTGALAISSVATAGAITLLIGRKYTAAFKNSSSGHYSNFAPISASSGAVTAKRIDLASIPESLDTQVDKVAILATADGGDESVLYLVTEINDGTTTYNDDMPETTLLTQPILFSTDESGVEFGIVDNDPPTEGLYNPVKHRGRIYMHDASNLYWSKNLTELTTSSGFLAGLWEEAWSSDNRRDVTEGGEQIRGILSDGANVYIGTQYKIRRFSGDAPFLETPDIIHNQAGLLNQDTWQIVYREDVPVGAMWLTPDFRVMISDFNTYTDAGLPIQGTLATINVDAAETWSKAVFYSKGPYDLYILAIPTGSNTRADTLCVLNLRTNRWVIWTLADTVTALFSNIQASNAPQLLIAAPGAFKIYSVEEGLVEDRINDTPVAVTVTIRTSWLDLGDPVLRKHLNELDLMTTDSSLSVTVEGASDLTTFDTPRVVVTARTVKAGPFGEFKVFLAASGSRDRYYRFTFSSASSVADALLHGITADVIPLSRI